jgi:flagellin
MPLGVLNNISAVYAENNLNQTQSSLQNVLTQLSSGSKINSGADDPAGLSIANGLAANSAALTQSSSNASEGAGFLQVADGALSQVTSLLTSAVTLATEAGGGTLSNSQMAAANQEYQDILTQIGTIGSTTEYNGITVFSSDQTTSALTWGNAWTSATTASSATGAASQLAAGAIVAGGTTAGTAPAQTLTYGSTSGLTWTAGGSGATSVLTTGPIAAGAQLSGTLAFSPTVSAGSPTPISVNLANVTGSTLAAQATSLAGLINTAAGATDYTVNVVGGDQLQIGLAAHASTDDITGFGAPSTSGSQAPQTGFTVAVAAGDSLGGTLTVTPSTTTPGGTPANVTFGGSGTSSITASITSGDLLSGGVTITGNIPQSGGVATPFSWSSNSGTYSATVASGDTLSGGFTITSTGNSQSPVDVTLTGVTTANLVSTINTDLGSLADDYTVAYNSTTGALSIGVNSSNSDGLTAVSVANDGGAATGTTPIVSASTVAKTLNLAGVTTANLASTLQTELGSDFTASYSSGTLTIGISNAGTTAGITTLTSSSNTVQQATPAVTAAGTPVAIALSGVTSANLASTVATALNGSPTASGDYNVSYAGGSLTVSLNAQAATDKITGIGLSGALTQTSANAATLTVADGDTMEGKFTITPTINGSAGSAVNVNLAGVTTGNLVSTVQAALGTSASDYNVTYNAVSGVGTLSIAANAAGLAAGVNSVSIANASGNNALSEGTIGETNIVSTNTVMGNFTVTPATSAGAGSAVNVDLQGVSNANLLSTVQAALGTNYQVAYNSTSGNLTIGVSSTGAAAGITSFTVAEASQQAASQETPVTGGVNIYTSDGTTTGSQNYNVTVGTLSDVSVGTSSSTSNMGDNITATVGGVTGTGGVQSGAGAGTSLTGTTLSSQAAAEAALQTVDNAINAVAYQRGQVGANINTLTAASNIASSQMTNITSAENTITATDYAAATSNMSKYEILTQTGISALAQANSTQQMVTKLLQ